MRTKEELSDVELSEVSGGTFYKHATFSSAEEVQFVANIGDIVEVATTWGFGSTVRCRVVNRRIAKYFYYSNYENAYVDVFSDIYECVALESHWYFTDGWKSRPDIEIPNT